MHYKKLFSIITLSAALTLAACSNNANTPNSSVTDTNTAAPTEQTDTSTTNTPNSASTTSSTLTGLKFTSEDSHQATTGNITDYVLYENNVGIYYTTGIVDGPDLHFYDKETKKSIYLCNKPECPHDGNEFCAATNNKYKVYDHVVYNDKILMLACEEKGTQTEFKILCASMDGASLDELVTFYTSDAYGFSTSSKAEGDESLSMVIHRNKLIAGFALTADNYDLNDSPLYIGSVIIDLNTREVQFLSDKPMDPENEEIQNIIGYGNYIYYTSITNGKPQKKTLCRYNVTTGEIEKYKPASFKGYFAVLDEDNILYHKTKASNMSIYTISQDLEKDYSILYSVPYYIPAHTSQQINILPDGSSSYEDVEIAECYVAPMAIGTDFVGSDGEHIYTIFGYDSLGYIPGSLFAQYDEMENEEANFGQNFTMSVYRLDVNLAHYLESKTAFSPTVNDEGVYDLSSFGKDPGYEFEVVDLRKIIDYKSDQHVSVYLLSVWNGKMYLRKTYSSAADVHQRVYVCDIDKFYAGEPDWELYLEW